MGLLKNLIYMILAAMVFYFLLGNLAQMSHPTHMIQTDGLIQSMQSSDTNRSEDEQHIQKDLQDYVNQLSNQSQLNSKEAQQLLIDRIKFKNKGLMPNPKQVNELLADKHNISDKDTILNSNLKNLSLISNQEPHAPELENFEDYAPTTVPINVQHGKPILATNKTIPDYMLLTKNAYTDKSAPLPINEFSDTQPANFTSERRAPWNQQISGDNLSNFYKHNPFKSFDDISKTDVLNPAEWDLIAKKREASSPLLSMNAMKDGSNQFMPSNHFDSNKKFSGLC